MQEPLKLGEQEVQTIYDVLDVLRVRPGMWIGEPSVTRLSSFLAGFSTGLHCAQRSLDQEAPAFASFHDWIAQRLGGRANQGWPDMLLEAASGIEAVAFERFWSELDAFRAQ